VGSESLLLEDPAGSNHVRYLLIHWPKLKPFSHLSHLEHSIFCSYCGHVPAIDGHEPIRDGQ
jgi:hypothetical protein